MASGPRVGEQAPDFTLPGVPGRRDYRLSDYRGRVVVVVFYPGDNTPVCTLQLTDYQEGIEQFGDLGAEILAVSPQDLDSHEAFAAEHGFAFPLLADAGKAVGSTYGILGPVGFYRRSVFVVDPDGVIRYAHRATAGLTFKRTDELLAAIRGTQPV